MQTILICTYCKHGRPVSYYYPSAPAVIVTQHNRLTRSSVFFDGMVFVKPIVYNHMLKKKKKKKTEKRRTAHVSDGLRITETQGAPGHMPANVS